MINHNIIINLDIPTTKKVKKEKPTKEIDYYGETDNYIHLKFGNARKCYNFTEDFKKQYPNFSAEYLKYWNDQYGYFKNAYTIIKYIKDNEIPVHLYFNFTDTPCTPDEAIEWWFDNNTLNEKLDK